MADVQKSKFNAFWIIVIVLLLILGTLVMFRDVLTGSERVSQEPQPTSTEWTTRPAEGVEVTLPETPMGGDNPADEPPAQTAPEEGE